jgi:high-affinity Fe2+/Pb2+ permease
MLALFVLLISLGIFRALGAFGVSAFSTWIGSTRYALALMFLFTSTAHFNKMRHDLARMMPKAFSNPMAMVYLTGICEILGAAGISSRGLAPSLDCFS